MAPGKFEWHFKYMYVIFERILVIVGGGISCDKIVSRSPSFPNLDDVQKLKYIVDLNCPPEVINQCCKFIAEIYVLRERQSTANSWMVKYNICIENHLFAG